MLKAKLVAMRKAAGLTQRQLAKKLGRENSFVDRLEAGERRIDLVELLWICKALGAPPEKTLVDLLRQMQSIGRSRRTRRKPARE